MKKANLRLMGFLCPRIKHRIQHTVGFYQWFLISLIVNLFVSCQALAQEVKVQQMPSAATVSINDFKETSTLLKIDGDSPTKEQDTTFQEKITPLKIGDKIPDELWEMYFPVISSAYEKEQYLSLGDFKDKLIILDFWATWCSPCVAMIPVMDSLQKEFKDEVQFLSVTYQKKEEVLPFLAKLERVKEQKYHLPVLANDDHLVNVFPHNQLPHYVWIEKGVVKSITGYKEVNAGNIQASISKEEKKALKAKVDGNRVPYNANELLFVNGNGGNGKTLTYHSVLAVYDPNLKAMYSYRADSVNGDKVSLTNHSLYDLFATSFDEREKRLKYSNKNRIDFKVKNPSLLHFNDGLDFSDWIKKNGYSYEIKVPAHLNDSLYAMMRYDLEKLFPQYKAFVEKRKTMCLVLVRTSKKDKIKSKSTITNYQTSSLDYNIQNGKFSRLLEDLNLFLLQNSPYPIVDGTGYEGRVDINIEANLTSVSSINKALEKYDLKFIEEEREIDKVVIQDRY